MISAQRLSEERYHRWYFAIVDRAHARELAGGIAVYTERHHIIPKAVGGGNEKTNFAELTYREHFLVHWILSKWCTGRVRRRMQSAISSMTMKGRITSGWQYEIAKRANRDARKGTGHNLTGKRFGKLVVIKRVENNRNGRTRWLCQCDCGRKTQAPITSSLNAGTVSSCGCIVGGHPLHEIAGLRFGKLVVIERAENNGQGKPKWKCKCDCGGIATKCGTDLKRVGKLVQCSSCARKEKKNGPYGRLTPEYRSWLAHRKAAA